ncbi:hypothetical protein CHUAL_014233 [Chamberlinius hualienensis]
MKLNLSYFLVSYFAIYLVKAQEDLSPVVQVQQGLVVGTIKLTAEGRSFYAFRGIPFGKAPVGALRFKAPEEADPWEGVFQATTDPPHCVQLTFDQENPTTGVEDCLQLSVYTPILSTNDSNPSMPVLVFIHGGEYVTGDIDYDYISPQRYMDYNTVFVAMKYRLGALGFLSTDDDAASGNAGLLDQNLALQWVKKNIAVFGGNPDDVTLSGQSAGSSSVIFQYISPMSSGLFHRAIGESGTALSPWAVVENPLYYAKKMAENFNCTTNNTNELVDCLREVDPYEIQAHTMKMMVDNLTICFVPNIETSPSGKFLTDDPYKLLESGNFNQVPLQLGFNRDEGCIIYQYVYNLFTNVTDYTFDYVIPILLDAATDYTDNFRNISYAIKDQYYTDVNYDNQIDVNIATIKWISDLIMKSGICKTAALVSSHNVPTYLYAYNYVSSHSASNFTGEPDVLHSDEMQYLLYRNITDSKDAEFGSRLFPLWLNFIMDGQPTPTAGSDNPWLKTPPGQYNYYEINEQFTMNGNYDTSDMEFWWNTVPEIANS